MKVQRAVVVTLRSGIAVGIGLQTLKFYVKVVYIMGKLSCVWTGLAVFTSLLNCKGKDLL